MGWGRGGGWRWVGGEVCVGCGEVLVCVWGGIVGLGVGWMIIGDVMIPFLPSSRI